MDPGLAIPLVLALVLGGAFILNEWSGGGVSVMLGLGEHHLGPAPMRTAHAHATGSPCAAPAGGGGA